PEETEGWCQTEGKETKRPQECEEDLRASEKENPEGNYKQEEDGNQSGPSEDPNSPQKPTRRGEKAFQGRAKREVRQAQEADAHNSGAHRTHH
ncbi:uncharacterized protein METZ01_LOCUS490085, partial [marine metagenome]